MKRSRSHRLTIPRRKLALVAALIASLFLAGNHPASVIAMETWHDAAHVAALAAIAYASARAWPRRHWLAVAAGVALLSGLHELSQELTSAHAAEWSDVVFNAMGSLLGASLARWRPLPVTRAIGGIGNYD